MPITNTPYIIYFDGACEPVNSGGTASCAVIPQVREPIWMSWELNLPADGHQTSNNLAEYSGLIALLECLALRQISDSPIVGWSSDRR